MPLVANEEGFYSIKEVPMFGLTWSPVGMSRAEFQLMNGQNHLLAKAWKQGKKAEGMIGKTSEARLNFKRGGFLGRKIEILREGTNNPEAIFQFTGLFGGGAVKYPDGRQFLWSRKGAKGESWQFTDPHKTTILDFAQIQKNIWLDETAVNIPREMATRTELPLLIQLGWHLILLIAINEHGASDTTEPYYQEQYR